MGSRRGPPGQGADNLDVTMRILPTEGDEISLSLRRVKWKVEAGPLAGKEFHTEGDVVRIGSDPSNTLGLADPSVSRRHAEAMSLKKGFLVRDLDSTNGTFLEEHRVQEAFVMPGARLRLGNSVLVFRFQQQEIHLAPENVSEFHGLVGSSLAMRRLFGVLARLAPTELNLVLYGETGSGKEMVSRAIHAASRRASGPLVVLDCSAVDDELISSELFGHEEGAFTGASRARAGAFELAHGGTLFIDEVGELALAHQAKLLRALERREVKRLGSEQPIRVDCRVVAATHRDLQQLVAEGRFREDLYYRFAQAVVEIPPLRERREDIPLLAESFLKQGRAGEAGPAAFEPAALQLLQRSELRGNVRELRNIVERARALATGDRIGPDDLLMLSPRSPASAARVSATPAAPSASPAPPAEASAGSVALDEVEREAILRALKANHYHRARTAAALGVSLPTLRRQIRRHGIDIPERGEPDAE